MRKQNRRSRSLKVRSRKTKQKGGFLGYVMRKFKAKVIKRKSKQRGGFLVIS